MSKLNPSNYSQDVELQPLLCLIKDTALCLWKEWSRDMHTNLFDIPNRRYTLSGTCPHCNGQSAFLQITNVCAFGGEWISGMQCQGCQKFILSIVHYHSNSQTVQYIDHYPMGKPSDSVAQEVVAANKGAAEDFSEGLRCLWVKAYKACVVMCRRAVQASALALGAPPKKKLMAQIDYLFGKGKITEPLKDFAHEVRLVGNRGAHPDGSSQQDPEEADEVDDGLEDVTEKDAQDIVEFTREYFHHVYVMPAKLKARRPQQSANA